MWPRSGQIRPGSPQVGPFLGEAGDIQDTSSRSRPRPGLKMSTTRAGRGPRLAQAAQCAAEVGRLRPKLGPRRAKHASYEIGMIRGPVWPRSRGIWTGIGPSSVTCPCLQIGPDLGERASTSASPELWPTPRSVQKCGPCVRPHTHTHSTVAPPPPTHTHLSAPRLVQGVPEVRAAAASPGGGRRDLGRVRALGREVLQALRPSANTSCKPPRHALAAAKRERSRLR